LRVTKAVLCRKHGRETGLNAELEDAKRVYREKCDTLAMVYDTLYKDTVSKWEDRRVTAALSRLCKSTDIVADLGCGTGLFLDIGVPYANYNGYDFSGAMLEQLECKYWKHVKTRKVRTRLWDISTPPPLCLTWQADVLVSLFGACSHSCAEEFSDWFRLLKTPGRFYLMFNAGHGDAVFEFSYQACGIR
jgi:SAM-dependent methyltransferase